MSFSLQTELITFSSLLLDILYSLLGLLTDLCSPRRLPGRAILVLPQNVVVVHEFIDRVPSAGSLKVILQQLLRPVKPELIHNHHHVVMFLKAIHIGGFLIGISIQQFVQFHKGVPGLVFLRWGHCKSFAISKTASSSRSSTNFLIRA